MTEQARTKKKCPATLVGCGAEKGENSGELRLDDRVVLFIERARLFGRMSSSHWLGTPLEERRRLPVVAEPRAIRLHPLEDDGQADRIGIEHRSAAMPREPEAVAVDDVDVARAQREAIHVARLLNQLL